MKLQGRCPIEVYETETWGYFCFNSMNYAGNLKDIEQNTEMAVLNFDIMC